MNSATEVAVLTAYAVIKPRVETLTEAEQLSYKLLIKPVAEALPGYTRALNDERLANELSLTDELPEGEEDLRVKVRELQKKLDEELVHYSELVHERNDFQGHMEHWKRKCADLQAQLELKEQAYLSLNSAYELAQQALTRQNKRPKPALEVALDVLEMKLNDALSFVDKCTDVEVMDRLVELEPRRSVRTRIEAKLWTANNLRYQSLDLNQRLDVDPLYRRAKKYEFLNSRSLDSMKRVAADYRSLPFLEEILNSSRVPPEVRAILEAQVQVLSR